MDDNLPQGTLIYRVGQLENDVNGLSSKVDRLLWALVTLTLSIAGSAVIFALTVISIGRV